MRREDYPRWMRISRDVRVLVLCAVLIPVGVRCIVLGHTAGKLISVALAVIAVLAALRILVWSNAKRFVKPSY